MAYNVSGLTTYVENNKDVLIRSIVLGGKYGDTIRNLRKQLGVKTKERLNYLDVTPVLQNGQGCGFSASGSTVLSERDIETAIFKVNDEWCPDDLLAKFAEYMVKFGANANAEDGMPFEAEIMDQIEKGIAKQMEKLVWQGDKTGNGDLIDGFLTQALGADSASTINVSYTAATSAISIYDAVKAAITAIPEEIIDEAVLCMSPAIYRALVFELVEKNLYHFAPGAEIEDDQIIFPGTNVICKKVHGLAGDKKHMYASVWDNMVFATDLLSDVEEMRLWFSDDADTYRLKVKYNAGVAVLYPDSVVVLTSTNNLVA